MSELGYVEKYRPDKLEDMVLNPETKNMIKSYLDKGTMCNLLLVGRAGIGKSTLARIIPKELNAIDLSCDSNRPRNKQTEGIVVGKYNHFISRLEETIKSANKLGTNLPSPSFTRLEFK